MKTSQLARALAMVVVASLSLGAVASPGRITSYRNPILPGFHPDPSLVRVGEDFYLVTSSFEMFPAVPIFQSRDLVNWKPLGHVLTRRSQLDLSQAAPSLGIFAPTLRHHAGTFYMATTHVGGRGNFYVTANAPTGPWSEPILVTEQGGIDPSLFFDDDGQVYFTSTGGKPGAPGERGIYQSTIDVATGKLTSEPRLVWAGTGGRYPEGPHLYKLAGQYYLMISEGGTEYGHMVVVARSRSPWGPFEACPRNPILTHRDTQMDQRIQGTGHPDLVQDSEGHFWMTFLAFRPTGGGYWHHLGRETFLAPVRFDNDGWPVVNEGHAVDLEMKVEGLPARPWPVEPDRDEFDSPLGPRWSHLRNPESERYSTNSRPGWLRLAGSALTLGEVASPTFLARPQAQLTGRIAVRIDFAPTREGDEAGLALYRHPQHRYELGVRFAAGRREVFVRQTVGPRLSFVTNSTPAPGTQPIVLAVAATDTEYTFLFGPALDRLTQLDTAPTRLLSTEVAGGFIGTVTGPYATGNGAVASQPADFDWFEETAAQ